MVLDESQAIKNGGTLVAHASHRLQVLTASPPCHHLSACRHVAQALPSCLLPSTSAGTLPAYSMLPSKTVGQYTLSHNSYRAQLLCSCLAVSLPCSFCQVNKHRMMTQSVCAQAGRRWCLSGTPIQNSIDDLYSCFRFLRYDPYCKRAAFKTMLKEPLQDDPLKGAQLLQVCLKVSCVVLCCVLKLSCTLLQQS